MPLPPRVLLPGILLAAMPALALAAGESSRPSDASLGRDFFQQNCAICHASGPGRENGATAGQGPSLAGLLGPCTQETAYVVLDLASKMGFSVYALVGSFTLAGGA